MVVRCSKCNSKVFKYYKKCPGRLRHLWKENILEDHSKRDGDKVICPKCGNIIGIEKKAYIKLIKGAYRYR